MYKFLTTKAKELQILLPSKIFISGHRGLIGSTLRKKLREKGFTDLVERTRQKVFQNRKSGVCVSCWAPKGRG
jgi:hypothetical protein